jgi:GTP pyrophosphokinase
MVNGVIKPLDEALSNGDRVEILSQKNGTPNLNWLSGRFLVTSRARNRVRNYFNRQNADEHFIEGRNQLDRLKSRFRLSADFISFAVERFKVEHEKALTIRIGQGSITSDQLSRAVQDFIHPKIEPPKNITPLKANTIPEVFIPGIGRATAHFAQCCTPQPPEPIIGLLTRNHGLRVHRQDCTDLLALPHDIHQRLIKVRWGTDTSAETNLCVDITAIERDNLLSDLVMCLTKEGIRIGHFGTLPTEQSNTTRIRLELSLPEHQDWFALMDKIEALDHVIDVKCCISAS